MSDSVVAAASANEDSPLGGVADPLANPTTLTLSLHHAGSAGGSSAGGSSASADGGSAGVSGSGGGGASEPAASAPEATASAAGATASAAGATASAAGASAGWELSVGVSLGSSPPAKFTNLHLPSITIPQLDLHAWSQALHGNHGVGLGFGLRGLAGNALLNPSPLARQGGALAGPARPSGNPFADLSRGGHAGLGAGIAAPAPGRAGFALAALADQAAANIADTRPTLDGATLHVGDAVLTAGSAAGAVGDNSVTNRLPGLTLTTLSLDPNNPGQQTFTSSTFQNSQSGTRTWGDLARPNGLAQHLVAAPARVHDPETFDDGTTGDSTFTLHAEGDDANGHLILDESGSTHTVWNEWGDDTSDHWTLDETGSFTATFHYVGQDPTTTTIPIDVHQSSDAEESPAGFDLEAYNQTLFYSTDSITVWDIDADGSETYHAHVQ